MRPIPPSADDPSVRIIRIWADDDGTSHFEEADIELEATAYAPPAPRLDVSAPIPAERALLCSFPTGWFGDWHPSPRRQLYLSLGGWLEVEVGDGEVRSVGPGQVVLLEDLKGAGHTTRVTGAEPSTGAFVHLADGSR